MSPVLHLDPGHVSHVTLRVTSDEAFLQQLNEILEQVEATRLLVELGDTEIDLWITIASSLKLAHWLGSKKEWLSTDHYTGASIGLFVIVAIHRHFSVGYG